MFAAFKIIATFLLACVSVAAALAHTAHPLLMGCAGAAFAAGIIGAEGFRFFRSRTVRSYTR